MEDLDVIGAMFGTDKSFNDHDYLRHYASLLVQYRRKEFNFVEIGSTSASLATWRSYFTAANIIGAGGNENSPPDDHVAFGGSTGIVVETGSLDDPGFLLDLARRYPPRVVIDGASHAAHHAVFTFETLFPVLHPGGVYIVEGLHADANAGREDFGDTPDIQPAEYFLKLGRTLVAAESEKDCDWGFRRYARTWIDEVVLFPHGCAIRKKQPAPGAAARLEAVEQLAARSDTADIWERAALFIKRNGGGTERIVAALNSAIAARPSSRLYRNVSEIHAAAGRMDDALAAAHRAVQMNENDDEQALSLEHYGQLLVSARQVETALEVFSFAMERTTDPVLKERIKADIAQHQSAA